MADRPRSPSPRWLRASLAALTLTGVLTTTLAGQAPAPRDSLSLVRALELARQTGPGLRSAKARGDVAAGRARELSQWANPTVEYRRENLESTLPPDIFATLVVPFDLTGRRFALRSAGRAGVQRAAGDQAAERREAELQVARAWLRTAAAQEQVAVATTQTAALDEVAAVDAARVREGAVAEAVALRTRLEADRAAVSRASAESELARARGELSRALGLPHAAQQPVASLVAPALPTAPDSAEAVTMARNARPELAAREAGVREAEARYAAETRGALGDVQLQGGSKKTAGVMTGQLGIVLPLPVFHRNDGARQRARGELAEATALRDDIMIAVQADVLAARTAYVGARDHARAAATFADRGREIVRIARTSYREGHASLIELLDAERAAADAVTAHIRLTVEAWLARLDLERALGARLDADSPLDLPLRAASSSTSR